MSVCVLTSQPFATLPSQFEYPESQALSVHAPVAHDSVACARSHEVLHAPQCVRLLRDDSQPLAGLASQLPNPALHTGTQVEPVHDVEPFAFVQLTPHAPQLGLALSCVSHPFVIWPSQLAHPALHVIEQAPDAHDGVPFAVPHAWLHAPQCSVFVCVLVSHPLRRFPSQLANPELQTGAQVLETHEVVPFAFEHGWLHAPQCATVVWRLVSHPLTTLPSQLPKPLLQTGTHTEATHEVEPLALVHALSQAPQWLVLVWVLVSHPLLTFPSQSA